MSTPEQPDTPPLTRKQMREIRNTGANPVIDTGAIPVVAPAEADEPSVEIDDVPVAPPPFEASLAPVAPLPRPAEPVILPEAPIPDRSVDLGVSPLTRRQARQQERIRTASVPVITPDVAASYLAESAPPLATGTSEPVAVLTSTADPSSESAEDETGIDAFAALGVISQPTPVVTEPEPAAEHEPEPAPEQQPEPAAKKKPAKSTKQAEPAAQAEAAEEADTAAALFGGEDASDEDESGSRVIDPSFGAALLAGEAAPAAPLAPSFDELITRSANGSVATPNALILSQAPDGGPIVAPVNATGEVLITGTFNLPEGLGSTGHAPGTADGKEVDAVLVDGELPAHSSPTPIAASAAVSTTKTPGEIIKPPTPEKGGRLMLTLAITAGALALALVGVLIVAFATGVL
ncbi:hypothetical protein ACH3VR_06440 [Microbacterium sp. B2969]|uniref:Uncharacterized protein n=1 Tax=Microbacterium alkaliflavum TaxID=3248839 RepID=A0ABW7Q554_9MICO